MSPTRKSLTLGAIGALLFLGSASGLAGRARLVPAGFGLSAGRASDEAGAAARVISDPVPDAAPFPDPSSFSLARFARRSAAPGLTRAASQEQPSKAPATSSTNWGRSYAELASLIAFTQTLYWIRYANFVEDWQYKLSWADQRERLFTLEAWRFDTNLFRVNWTHQLAGSLYYEFARSNRLTWLESTLVAGCGALWWELVTEWREVISINDLIFTTIGGYAGGESFYQLGRFLQDSPGETAGVLSLLNPVLQLNRWMDGAPRGTGAKAAWHRFDLSFGLRAGSGPTIAPLAQTAGLRTQIINVPGYGRPGRGGGFLFDTLSNEIDFSVVAKGREGHAFALNEFSREHDIRGAKTTMLYYGYYYALGVTVGAEVNAEYRALRGRGLVRYQVYDSVERLDRFQERIDDDWDVHDDRLRLLGSAALRLPHSPLELQAVLEGVSRRGTILDVTNRELETRFSIGVNLVF